MSSFVRRLCQIGDKARSKCWMITTEPVSGEEMMKSEGMFVLEEQLSLANVHML